MHSVRFEFFEPTSLDEALRLLAESGDQAYLMAGGTDLLVKINHGLLEPKTVIGLKRIDSLSKITFEPGKGLTIGATALLADVASHPDILAHYPTVAYAARNTANVQIRNMGTVVGNLCNAAPSADNAPTLTAMGAEVVIRGRGGERRVALEEFFQGPGATAVQEGEIVTAVFVPIPPERSGTSYKYLSARGKVDIAAVCVGVMISLDPEGLCKDARIVLGAVGPTPFRAAEAEALLKGRRLDPELIGRAGEKASEESRPIT
ncbi:MAG: FAD binding domain-containing protein, partial [Desulfobacteraceae bacterium]